MRRWIFILVFISGVVWFRQNQLTSPTINAPTNQLEVHFIDVGQGDSIFIRTSDGSTALIDGGPSSSKPLAYLQALGITKIDVMILTHPHQDHLEGLLPVMETLSVGGVWTSGSSNGTRIYERFLDTIDRRHIPYHEVQTSQTIPLGALSFSVLYGVGKDANLNNTSLVLRLSYGQTSFLFTGDAEKAVEKTLINTSASFLPSTVLKIGHHGSNTSSSPAFVQAISPQIAIYSAGRGNQYGHPHQSTLNTFAALNIPVYGTNKLGSIIVASDGTHLSVTSDSGTITNIVPNQMLFPITPIYATPFAVDEVEFQDRDCGGFDTHEEAQTFFIEQGGPLTDRHRLDGDNDGIACESLP